MNRSRVALGAWGEAKVARHYEHAGYRVLDRNWRMKGGEIDLVLSRDDEIVFCEVKTRSSARFGHGVEAIGPDKQRFVRRAAATWLAAAGCPGRLRFDVAVVHAGRIEVIEAAF